MSKRERDRLHYKTLHIHQVIRCGVGIGGIVLTLAFMLARDFDSALITSLMATIAGATAWAQSPEEGE